VAVKLLTKTKGDRMKLLDLIKQFGQANYNAGYFKNNYDQYGTFDEERLKLFEQIVSQLEPQVLKKIAVEYKDGWIILLKQGDITISYPKSDVKQFIEDLSRALNGERLSTLH